MKENLQEKLVFLLLLLPSLFIVACNTNDSYGVNNSNQKINQPNILWLVAEDLSPYIPTFGDSTVKTPNLSRLALEGISYDQTFAPHPVCAPARASIITGMYANHIAASHMRTGPWYNDNLSEEALEKYRISMPENRTYYEAVPPPEVKMFTEYLRAAGYYCTNNSKQDYQFLKTMTAWDECDNKAHWRNRKKDQPFFSVFNFNVTHESQIWAKKEDTLRVDAQLEPPIPPYLPNTEIAKNDIRRMYSNIIEMDNQIGKIISELESDGLLENTIIFWYSDHGGPLPRQKRMLFDSGIKVPMIIRFPGKEKGGTRDNRMISFIDFAPTVLSLAGIRPPEHMDGSAFLGKYQREEEPLYVFGAADRFDETTDAVRSVRDHRFKYIKYYMPEKSMFLDVRYRNQMPIMQELLRLHKENNLTPEQALWFQETKPEEAFYDLKDDPHELVNLIENKEHKSKIEAMRSALSEWVTSINDTGLKDERLLINKLWPDGKQPMTEDPEILLTDGKISLSSETPGASIGYKLNSFEKAWRIYDSSFTAEKSDTIFAKAHRLGYKQSQQTQLVLK